MHISESLYNQSVMQQVDSLIKTAIEKSASDIHCEPTAHHLRIRFRIDGILHDQPPIESFIMRQVISRLKVLARMNIAEKRLPQDGKFSMVYDGKPIDFRVSTFPALFGEKVVVRILDRAAHAMSLEQLGFDVPMLAVVKELARKQSGLFLVTGPTGSGKTTTLYAILSFLHAPDKNIITLENPVEYNLEGITQGHINTDVGFTFEKGIRSLLRQDPDILMVGEIRDKATASIAIQAALTGHLVFSTLHTNDCLHHHADGTKPAPGCYCQDRVCACLASPHGSSTYTGQGASCLLPAPLSATWRVCATPHTWESGKPYPPSSPSTGGSLTGGREAQALSLEPDLLRAMTLDRCWQTSDSEIRISLAISAVFMFMFQNPSTYRSGLIR
jgi:energy-coupling factor transporter ATP-binding protein EcfA2